MHVADATLYARSIRSRLREAGTHGLPGGTHTHGPYRCLPPRGYNPLNALPRGRSGAYLNRFGMRGNRDRLTAGQLPMVSGESGTCNFPPRVYRDGEGLRKKVWAVTSM